MKKFDKIIKILLNILTGIALIIILIFVYGTIQKMVSGNNYPNYFGYTFFKVTSGSMGEAVKIDDVIIVKVTKDVKLKDIVTFVDDDAFITHRVIKMNGNLITTKGDANNAKDVAIKKDALVGKVVCIITGFNVWKQIMTTPKILLSICITIIMLKIAFSCKVKEEINRRRIYEETIAKRKRK